MRRSWQLAALACFGGAWLGSTQPAPAPEASAPANPGDDILPIFAQRCQPCHFPGGSMYSKLPFDDARTIHTLGERVFTRIKDPDEQQRIRTFLADTTATSAPDSAAQAPDRPAQGPDAGAS